MYQNNMLPYFIIPSTFSPQASSPLTLSRRHSQQSFVIDVRLVNLLVESTRRKSHCPTLEAEDFMSTYVNDILIETCANILIASIVTIVKRIN